MNHAKILTAWATGLALLTSTAPAASAQRLVEDTKHQNQFGLGSEYGRAVANGGDLDGDGFDDAVIGAPGSALAGTAQQHGAVFFGTSFLRVDGDGLGDRLGTSIAANLNLDGAGAPDVIAGAPGDDDAGADAGSVAAFTGERVELYTILGTAPGDDFGQRVAALGDLDADGRSDYLVGAPQDTSGGAGYVRVVSGIDGSEIRSHAGVAPGDRFGLGLTGIADLDGDGVDDYAVGAPQEAGLGSVRVYSGASGAPLQTLTGTAAGGLFGFALGAGADLDRDGLDELLVGAPLTGGSGAVHALSGADFSELLYVSGRMAGDWFGGDVDGLSDFDGDGHGDIVVGASEEDPDFTSVPANGYGYTTVISGADGSPLATKGGSGPVARCGISVAGGGDYDGDGLEDALVGGIMNNDGYGTDSYVVGIGRELSGRLELGPDGHSSYGQSVADVDDLDGDGVRELLIGAPEALDGGGLSTGKAQVLSPATGAVIYEFYGDLDGDRLGQVVADAGDVNQDGVGDLLVSSSNPQREGQNLKPGYVRVFSGADGSQLHHFPGTGHVEFGSALAGGGDADGDGHSDILVGAASITTSGGGGFGGPGLVHVYSGRTGAQLFAVESPGDALGASVAFLGDRDGDGKDELLIGAPERFLGAPTFWQGQVELRSGGTGVLLGTYGSFNIRTGTALTRLGDVDADGFEDFAVSSWEIQSLQTSGTVELISGQTLTSTWVQQGAAPYQGITFGYALDLAGDVNGDGVGDVLVGDPGKLEPSAAAVGQARVLSGTNGSTLATYSGYSGWDYFGYSVTGLGDVNGDGTPDVAIGAPTEPSNFASATAGLNRVRIELSDDLRDSNYCLLSTNSTGAPATLHASGSSSLTRNDFQLRVAGAPGGKNGVFTLGSDPGLITFGAGYKCSTGTVKRLTSLVKLAPDGTYTLDVDLTSSPADLMLAGSTWNFQFLFRDLGTTDSTDAVRVDWLP